MHMPQLGGTAACFTEEAINDLPPYYRQAEIVSSSRVGERFCTSFAEWGTRAFRQVFAYALFALEHQRLF